MDIQALDQDTKSDKRPEEYNFEIQLSLFVCRYVPRDSKKLVSEWTSALADVTRITLSYR